MEILRLGIAAIAWPLAAGAMAASLAAQGGRFSARLDVLTHLAPVWLAAALLALTMAGFAPRGVRGPLALTAFFGAVAAVALMAPEFVGPPRAPRAAAGGAPHLKLVQFNVWGGNAQPQAVADWLAKERPDIIVTEEAGRVPDLLTAQGYVPSCPRCRVTIWARSAPLESYDERQGGEAARFISAATYADTRGPFTVVGVHRHWPVRFALAQAQTEILRRYLAGQAPGRLILAGDFNSTPWSFARRGEDVAFGLVRRTRALPTWPAARLSHNRLPAPFPYLPIDHVYAGPDWTTVEVRRGPRLGSDHFPVVVVLAPRDGA